MTSARAIAPSIASRSTAVIRPSGRSCEERPIVTASRTVTPAGTGIRCGTKARSFARSRPRSDRTSRPDQATVPALGFCSPETARTRVDLPAPFGPTTATSSPGVDLKVGAADDRRPGDLDLDAVASSGSG